MCGLTGLYSTMAAPERPELHRIVRAMTDTLVHRGPDSRDVWQDPDFPLALGHRRLAIIDLSPAGAQPMESACGRYMIAFNGEIYNFQDLRTQLENENGARFKGHSDTEVILAALQHWGLEKMLEAINGMFAFALWDRKFKALHLARDRFGKKPLYIGWAGSTLIFGSELKALCAHPDFRKDVSRAALTSYMRFGYVPAPLCMFEQVWQLPAGHLMSLDLPMLRGGQDLLPLMSAYWRHNDALMAARSDPLEGSDTEIFEQFKRVMAASVEERMIADVPLGAFLSGGIDSSSIVALMQERSKTAIKTYTIGFKEEGYNEAQHAAQIAKHLGTEHHELYLAPDDALDIIPDLPHIYDEPFADASALPTYLVSKFARSDVTVALSGDGGDEMLGGYNRHITGPKCWGITQNIPPLLRRPLADALQSVSPELWSKVRGKPQFGAHLHKFAQTLTKKCEGDVYMAFVSQWQNPKKMVLDGREEIIPLVDERSLVEGLSFAEIMMYWDTLSYLPGDILTKVDRASMTVSLEARAPFLDRRLYDFVWRLPIEYKIRNGKGKWLLRELLKTYIPQELFERPKQGFSVPIDSWLRGPLKDWAEDLLDEDLLREHGYLNYPVIRKCWDEHLKGRGNHAQRLWSVLMFQAWHRHWVMR